MARTGRIISKIERLAGDNALPFSKLDDHLIDGVRPELMVLPEREDQICEIVRLCIDGEVLLVPGGAEHQLVDVRQAGDRRPMVIVSTRRLKQYVGYSQEDLTLTVNSGLTLAELDGISMNFHQQLPIDPPYADSATVGGAVACNAGGPRSLMHGRIGNYVLGGAMVMADGELVRSGARTVKNVAGYDLHKMFVGSHGSLGIISQVALKLKPVPEDFRMAEILTDSVSEAVYLVGQLMRGQTRPCLLEIFSAAAAADFGHDIPPEQLVLRVGYEDTTEAVEWQLTQLHVSYGNRVILMDTDSALEEYRQMIEWPRMPCSFAFEASVLGGHVTRLLEFCNEQQIATVSHAASGVVLGRGQQPPTPTVAEGLRLAAGSGSSVRFTHLPPGSKIPRWGEMDQARKWMRTVKDQFDPNRIFPWPGFLGS